MNIKSKVFSLLLVCLMLLSVSSFMSAGAFTDVAQDHTYNEAITKLSDLGVINGYEDGTFKPENEVTRAEMAKLIASFFKLGSSTVTEAPFTDVPTDHWAASFIVSAKNLKVINGMGDGTFEPEGKVTYHQAVKMIVCALNYGIVAEENGGWNGNGYISTSQNIGLNKKAILGNDANAPRGLIAQLFFNALDIIPLVPVINADGTTSYVKGTENDKPLNQNLNTTTISNSLIIAVPDISLTSNENYCRDTEVWAMEGNVETRFSVGKFANAKDYLGQSVSISYTLDEATGTKTIVSLTPNSSNQTTVIDIDKISEVSDSQIVYYTNDDRDKTTNVKLSGTINKVYNQRADSNALKNLTEDIANGSDKICALGINGTVTVTVGNAYTFINVKSYRTYFISLPGETSNKVFTFKVDSADTKKQFTYSIPEDQTVKQSVIQKASTTSVTATNKNGITLATAAVGSIQRNTIVSVAESSKDAFTSRPYIEVLIGPNVLTSNKITGTTENQGYKTVTIGSRDYKTALGLCTYNPTLYSTIKNEGQGNFYLDAFANIAWVGTISAGDIKGGVLLSVVSSGSGVDKTYSARFFELKSGSVLTYTLEKATYHAIDEKGEKGSEMTLNEDSYNSLFLIKASSGNIVKSGNLTIVTTKAGTSLDNGVTTYACETDSYAISKDSDGNVTATQPSIGAENRGIKQTTSGKYIFGNIEQDGKITFPTDTKCEFVLSNIKTYVKPDETAVGTNRNMKPISGLIAGYGKYEGLVYSITEKASNTSTTSNYIFIKELKAIFHSTPVYVVSKVGGTTTVGDNNSAQSYDLSNFASPATKKTITVLASVASTLKLAVGDVFAYYEASSTSGIDIDKVDTVTVFLRASKALDDNAVAGNNSLLYPKDSSGEEIADKTTGFDYYGIYQAELSNKLAPEYFSYSLQMPLIFDRTEGTNGKLYFALGNNNETKLAEPYLPKNSLGKTFDTTSTQKLLEKVNYVSATPTSLWMYDPNASTENKLTLIEGPEAVFAALVALKTINDNPTSIEKTDLIFAKCHTNYAETLPHVIYVLKRTQAAAN